MATLISLGLSINLDYRLFLKKAFSAQSTLKCASCSTSLFALKLTNQHFDAEHERHSQTSNGSFFLICCASISLFSRYCETSSYWWCCNLDLSSERIAAACIKVCVLRACIYSCAQAPGSLERHTTVRNYHQLAPATSQMMTIILKRTNTFKCEDIYTQLWPVD